MTNLRDELTFLSALGFTHLDLEAGRVRAGVSSTPAEPQDDVVSQILTESTTGAILAEMARSISDCQLCALCKGRTQTVFGVGNPEARLMFIGEAPGRDEDLQGVPFVGRAGQLLTDIIKAMKLRREDVYIANVVKCRPPENRNPEPDEMEACRPFVMRQIEIIRPEVIVTLGKVPLQGLFRKSMAITHVRGTWMSFEGIRLMPTYHPAYLLRNPAAKRDVWNDMKLVMAELGIPS
jgi:uracil-DNA glycosylase